MALSDGLEQRRFADVCETNNTTLQVVARTTQKNLLLNDNLFGRHLTFLLMCVATCSNVGYRFINLTVAASRRNSVVEVKRKGRTCCGRWKEAGKRNEGNGGRKKGRRSRRFWAETSLKNRVKSPLERSKL